MGGQTQPVGSAFETPAVRALLGLSTPQLSAHQRKRSAKLLLRRKFSAVALGGHLDKWLASVSIAVFRFPSVSSRPGPTIGEIVESRPSCCLCRGGIDRPEIVLEPAPVLTRRQPRGGGSTRGAVSGLLPVRFLGPPAEPGMRFSPHRALHKCYRPCLLGVDQPQVWGPRPAISVAFDRHRRGLK